MALRKFNISDQPTGWYYVYILRLNDGSRYVGLTHNLIARLLRIAVGEYSTTVQSKGYDHLLGSWEFKTQENAAEFKDKMIAEYGKQGITCWPPLKDKYIEQARLMKGYMEGTL